MHDIEPFWNWRHRYTAEEDELSPFFGREYSEFYFTNAVYDHAIHPQWDAFGSSTLYLKILYADYDDGFAIIELIGECTDGQSAVEKIEKAGGSITVAAKESAE